MRIQKILACTLVAGCLAGHATVCSARDDLFSDHSKAMNSKANANPTNVYGTWGSNMAKQIERGGRGVLVKNGESSAEGVVGDGAGNVTIEKGAKIDGPIIIQNDFKNANIIGR